MNSLHVIDATAWLANQETIEYKDTAFVQCGFGRKVHLWAHPKEKKEQIQKIADCIQKKLAEASNSTSEIEPNVCQNLATAFINRYKNDKQASKIIKAFERQVAQFFADDTYQHPENKASYQKWIKNGNDPLIFKKHPDFCNFLESTGLQSQLKITRDVLVEVDGQPTLLVEGKMLSWPEVRDKFEAVYSKRYNETFVVDKQTRDVYTYLDNGKGLQPHHPYLSEFTPLSQLNETDYNKVLESAQLFVRDTEAHLSSDELQEKNKNRNFIFQLVSSHTEGPNTNFNKLLTGSRHPYLRIIVGEDNPDLQTKKGEVFEVGYGWQNKVAIPLISTQGQFRSPDMWEYQKCEEKIVTNIAVTQQEANALYTFTLKYHRDGVNLGNSTGFHLLHQNCSTYIRSALQVAGINVPTQITLGALIKKVAPDWMHAIGRQYAAVRQKCAQKINTFASYVVPRAIKVGFVYVVAKIKSVCSRIFKAIAAFGLAPIKAALGGFSGTGGVAFVPTDAPEERIEPRANWRTWFKFSYYRFNLPGILQEWQRAQASTVVYKSPTKLCIVP